MCEERMNPNFNLESCLRNKVNEAKRYLEDKHKRQKDEPCEESSYVESFIYYFQNVETILDLYQQKCKQNKDAKDYIEYYLLDNMSIEGNAENTHKQFEKLYNMLGGDNLR